MLLSCVQSVCCWLGYTYEYSSCVHCLAQLISHFISLSRSLFAAVFSSGSIGSSAGRSLKLVRKVRNPNMVGVQCAASRSHCYSSA